MKKSLASQDYWDSFYNRMELSDDDVPEVISDWLHQYIPRTENGSCFEIGCFPGRLLTTFGKLGYTLSGIDLTPRVEKEFPEWLRSRGYKTGEFFREDFLKFRSEKKYSIVCSFGFIEHFTNWKDIFEKHLDMVEPGGYVVIETPNFSGLLQRFIHYFLDRANYRRHYVPSMDPGQWKRMCERRGFRVLHSGYLGAFQFWVDQEPRGYVRNKLFHKLLQYTPRLQKRGPGKKMYAPYCGMIAQLPKDQPK